jgi:hypothetical protein
MELQQPKVLVRPHQAESTKGKNVMVGESKPDFEGPKWRTRGAGSEWEPIKILLEGDGGSNKMNTASNFTNPRTQRNTKLELTDLHWSDR